jgi:hypothetical protein
VRPDVGHPSKAKGSCRRLPETVAFGSCTTVKRAPRVNYESGARSAGCLPRATASWTSRDAPSRASITFATSATPTIPTRSSCAEGCSDADTFSPSRRSPPSTERTRPYYCASSPSSAAVSQIAGSTTGGLGSECCLVRAWSRPLRRLDLRGPEPNDFGDALALPVRELPSCGHTARLYLRAVEAEHTP